MRRNLTSSWNLLHEIVISDDSSQVPDHDGMVLGQVLDVLRKYIFFTPDCISLISLQILWCVNLKVHTAKIKQESSVCAARHLIVTICRA